MIKKFISKTYKSFQKSQKGFSMVEILIVISIILIGLISLLDFTIFSLKNSIITKEANEANALAQETIEAVRNFRDSSNWEVDGLGVLMNDIDYYPQKTGFPPEWQLAQGSENIGKFNRKINFSQVQRDGNDDIVNSAGIVDFGTKKVTVMISWEDRQIKIINYFTNWK
ncbi:prepilin-type N-terminal cleavage/methylation domain-containing protein [Patescibacteria group bacterium]